VERKLLALETADAACRGTPARRGSRWRHQNSAAYTDRLALPIARLGGLADIHSKRLHNSLVISSWQHIWKQIGEMRLAYAASQPTTSLQDHWVEILATPLFCLL
jgi:hypothetical protein